ncbi:glucose-6-phosphate isomerase [Demequina zhanjiangensis]|uniref:Glucose-6-phosphate isomerase n=1 Tax=Demequina zhanjiangensis TaxID=3051659 RepID=A0ABT8G209_9MICO|nr:glucose-6-phosphate isomerase [Demequina sp. SYSU T00b26]MDN4473176.1 glucose-6-phosphate isomerase [Demequina sp. SYSU T00b26]
MTSAFLSTWAGVDHEAHVAVTASGDAAESVQTLTPALVEERVASRLGSGDPTLWGAEAEADARLRLGWTALHETARRHLGELEELFVDLRGEGVNRVVLVGMGGSTLAPTVICATYGVPLVTLDSTEPSQVRAAIAGDLAATVVVVASKSGGTVETQAIHSAVEEAFSREGLDFRRRMVIVTDPGSPLERQAREDGCRALFLADPHVGGRFSALSAFGLVPAALAGVPVLDLLDEAAAVAESLEEDDPANPALVLGAALAGLRRTLVLSDHGSGIVGLDEWIEQLVAGSTGKNRRGIVPVVAEPHAPELTQPDVLDCRLVSLTAIDESDGSHLTVSGTLGGQLLLWQHSVAIASRVLGVNPFDEPDIDNAKNAAREILDSDVMPDAPDLVDQGVELRATDGLLDGIGSLEDAVHALENHLTPDGYLAILAFLDKETSLALPGARRTLASRLARPVSFAWGPRYVHSSGQLHKGGPDSGVYLMLSSTYGEDLEIPGLPHTFGRLIRAQATGDFEALQALGRPVLHLTLTDRSQVAAVAALLEG